MKSKRAAGLVVTPPNKTLYNSWGDQADTAIGQGWYVAQDPDTNGAVTFRSPYYASFNNIVIPNQKSLGHIALIGHPNKTFDIVVRDANGQVLNYINKGVSPAFVQNYITNSNSTVAQRNNSVVAGTNTDKYNDKGNYVSIK